MARSAEARGGTWEVDFGTAELVRDLDRPNGWMLLVDGTPQSYLDLQDPSYLEFDYVRWLADVVDELPPGPVTALHLGGGACTLARYVAATRPGSTQVVVEADGRLAEVVRAQLGTPGFKLRVGDGRAALAALSPTADLVVTDVFVGSQVPAHLATLEHVQEARRVLTANGRYAVNLGDTGPLCFARQQAAALAEVFAHVLVVADPAVLRGRRFGNLVLTGSDAPYDEDRLRRVTTRAHARARVVEGRSFAAGTRPATDAQPPAIPTPPPDLFTR
ncbi:MAG TPA: fused MFS/spermidine synthase [Mycobacteriales bacterium]|nr:fused MFS/spermidine synthase [Mycobacteriales bacterium]